MLHLLLIPRICFGTAMNELLSSERVSEEVGCAFVAFVRVICCCERFELALRALKRLWRWE